MKSFFEFLALRDPDSQFFLISIESLFSNLVAILFWMLINSTSINMIFVSSAAVATIASFKLPSISAKFRVMLFVCLCIAGLQFGLSVFILNKWLVLIFLFWYLIFIFSIKGYQVYAAMSIFPAVTIIGSTAFSYEDAVNRCFYQLIAFLIAFFLAVLFSILFSKFTIRKAVKTYLFCLLKRFECVLRAEPLATGYSHENLQLQKIGSVCLNNCVKKKYLLRRDIEFAGICTKLLNSLFAVSRGLRMLKQIELENEDLLALLEEINNRLLHIEYVLKHGERIKFSNKIKLLECSCNQKTYSVSEKNRYVLNRIVNELNRLDGLSLV